MKLWFFLYVEGCNGQMTHPKLLDGLNYKSKGEESRRKRNWSALPSLQDFEGRRVCQSSRMGLERLTSNSITQANLHKLNNKLVSAQLKHFGAQINHGQTRIHKIHHDCRNPTLAKCEDETHTPKNGDLESSGTPEPLELDSRGQNTSHWGVLYVNGKVLKFRCPKWPRMSPFGHLQPKLWAKEGPRVKLAV